jgi:hypothetical protein
MAYWKVGYRLIFRANLTYTGIMQKFSQLMYGQYSWSG